MGLTGDVCLNKLWVRVAWRTLPFLLAMYVMSYMDRTNVAFSRAPLSKDLDFSEAVYGIGSGLFFIGYFLLGIPGALMVEKWGARLVVSSSAVAWGFVTLLFTLVRTPSQFYILRFLLGFTAAPFFPGVIVHVAHWFPPRHRSRALVGFIVASPISLALAGPLSALILSIQGLGLKGWQWIFLIEGLLTVFLGFVGFFVLEDSPREVAWLTRMERAAISVELNGGASLGDEAAKASRWWGLLNDPSVVLLCAAYAFANIAGYGFIFWLPSAIKYSIGSSAVNSNTISAVPFGLSAIVMWLMARSSDRTGERKRHACYPMLFTALFLLLTVIPGQSRFLIVGWTSLAGSFVFGWIPGFWAMPTAISTGTARAVAVGLINSVGNLGGFLGPAAIGQLLTDTHSSVALPLLVSFSYIAAAGLIALVRMKPST
jgi:MFS transporter, ACS family, tartrate transporter